MHITVNEEDFRKMGIDPPCGTDPFYNRQVKEGLADLTGFGCNVLSFPLFCLKQYR